MAIKKKGGDEFAAQDTQDSADAPVASTSGRKPLTIAAIVGGGVLALGAAFGVGLAAGNAAPGPHDGHAFAAGAESFDTHGRGHGDRGGDGEHRGGLGKLQHSGEARVGQDGSMTDVEGDYCHPGDGHTHDADGNDVAPSDAAQGFTCQTGPVDESETVTPTPDTTP